MQNQKKRIAIGFQRFCIFGPFGNLGGQVALDLESDGIGFAGDVGAQRLGLVIAGPAAKVDFQRRCAGERDTHLERERPVALAEEWCCPSRW